MKVIIWFSCYFVLALIQTALREAGIIIGAIPMLLLYAVTFWFGKVFCSLWDEHKASKEVSDSPTSRTIPPSDSDAAVHAETEPESVEPVSDPVEPLPPAPATPKLRFCKLCGSPIDPATRKCAGCRKQYFRLPVFKKKHFAIAGASLVCAAVVILVFSLASQLHSAQSQISAMNNQITELEFTIQKQKSSLEVHDRNADYYVDQIKSKNETISDLSNTIELLQENNRELMIENYFYRQHIVLIGKGSKYHKYDCSYLDMSDGFLAYNLENAKHQGYKPCSHCCN